MQVIPTGHIRQLPHPGSHPHPHHSRQTSEPVQHYHHGRQTSEPVAMQQYYNNRQALVEMDYRFYFICT